MKKMYRSLSLLFLILSGWSMNAIGQATTVFNYTGTVQTFTVPPGVTQVVVNAMGATGGLNGQTVLGCTTTCGNMADSAGHGGCVVCTLAVTPGMVLDVYVGGRGADATTSVPGAGGYNGGGAGGLGYIPYASGGGGGASDVRFPPYALADRMVVAGGGGGAGGNWFLPPVNYDRGGDGGTTTGEAGTDGNVLGGPGAGGGGTPLSGGGPGSYSGWGTGTSGTFGVGGIAGSPSGGGGGGGGWYGGGGGSWGGGGGGSSYTNPTLCTGVTHTRGCNIGRDGQVKIIVLCTPPVGGAIVGPPSLCQESTVGYTNPTGTTGGVWSSSATSVATIGSSSGLLTGVSAGVTIITYSVSLSCGSAFVTMPVTVNPLPAPITGSFNICTGTTVTLSDATAGGTWSSANPAIASIGSSSGDVSGHIVGLTTITYTLPVTGCYRTNTVNVVGISGPVKVCALDTIHLSASTTGGSWSTSSTSIATIDAGGVLTGVGMGIVAVSYTVPGSGCVALWTVSVNPHAPIAGRDSVCVGSDGWLTNIVGGGIWSSTATAVATILPDSGKVSGHTAGITTISYLLPTGCLSTAVFTVIDYPGAITGAMQVCPKQVTDLDNPVPGGTWTSDNTGVATVDPGTGVVTGVFADTVHIVYTIEPGCAVWTRVKVNPLPDTITGPVVLCPNITDTFYDATPNGLWSSSPLSVATIDDTMGIVTSIAGGISVIKYTLPTGCFQTYSLTVRPIPVPALWYNFNTQTLWAPLGYASYQWYDSIQGKIVGATSPSLAAVNTEYYYVVVTDSFGCQGTSPYYHFDIRQVGVLQQNLNSQIRMYPNPANAMLYITSPVRVRAVISDVQGREQIDVADAREIDISKLANGVYMVTMYDDNGLRISVQKLVKE